MNVKSVFSRGQARQGHLDAMNPMDKKRERDRKERDELRGGMNLDQRVLVLCRLAKVDGSLRTHTHTCISPD